MAKENRLKRYLGYAEGMAIEVLLIFVIMVLAYIIGFIIVRL